MILIIFSSVFNDIKTKVVVSLFFLGTIPLNLHPIKMVLLIEGFAESKLKMQKACDRVIAVYCLFAVLRVT